ncbi:MAG: dihydroorotase [Dehalococcoidia bacterium]
MDILIKNGRIIDPSSAMDGIGDILIKDGLISAVDERVTVREGAPKIDASGMLVCPGFIDLHCHLREPGFEDKETIATGTEAAVRGGFTTICCMPNTEPPLDSPSILRHLARIVIDEGRTSVLPVGCVTEGRKGKKLADLVTMHKEGAVAFSDDGNPVYDDGIMRRALEEGKPLGIPIIDHCEDKILSGKGSMNEGSTALKLGYTGIPGEAEERMVERDIKLAGETGGWVHIVHVSTAGSVELVRQGKQSGINVTAEVTPHHLTLTEQAVITAGTTAKVNPPLRTERDRLALIEGLLDGSIDVIATDHAPHTMADKDCEFEEAAFGISGFETAFGSLMGLVHQGYFDLAFLISRLTCEPARILGKNTIGNLSMASEADVTIIDPDAEWIVDTSKFASKGRNTPLAGEKLRGKVVATVVGGRLVYLDEKSC